MEAAGSPSACSGISPIANKFEPFTTALPLSIVESEMPTINHANFPGGGPATYVVQSGDSLWSIASHLHIPLGDLIKANPSIRNINLIYPGQVLKLPHAHHGPAMPPSEIIPGRSGSPLGHAHPHPVSSPQKHNVLDDLSGLLGIPGRSGQSHGIAGSGYGSGTGSPSGGAHKPHAHPAPHPAILRNKPAPHSPLWLQIALHEYALWQSGEGQRRHSTYLHDTGGPNDNWCSIFVNWVMQKCNYSGTRAWDAASWLHWGIPLSHPKPGAIVIVQDHHPVNPYPHVAFLFKSYGPDRVDLLGGNQGGGFGAVTISNRCCGENTDFGHLKFNYRWPPH